MQEPPVNPPPIPPTGPPPPPEQRSIADLVVEVSENASTLVREEIELAKAEVSEKVSKLARGAGIGVAAGAFAFLALIMILHGIAWVLGEELFSGNIWAGYFVTAAIFLLLAALAGWIASKALKAGAPPVPEQAIEEAKLTKEMLEREAK
ncbi:MAG TPA: phage holin family protein [Solirubrobacterales bacterium]|nr:phage holin family protein [Solirubrobacterales bacterium]